MRKHPRRILFRRKVLIPILTWGITIGTFISLFLLSSYTIPIDDGDVMSISPFTLFTPPLIVLTAAACFVLIGTFSTTSPKTAYYGTFVYLGLLGFIFLALYYNNANIPYSGMLFTDLIRPLYGLLFVLVTCGLLLLLKKVMISILAYLMEVPPIGKVKHSRYQIPSLQGYSIQNEGETLSYEHYDEPATSYPPHILEQEL